MSADRNDSPHPPGQPPKRLDSRKVSIAILIVAVVALASVGYVVLSSPPAGTTPSPPYCGQGNLTCCLCPKPPEVSSWVPFGIEMGQTMQSVVEGLSFPAFVWISPYSTPSAFAVNWGDGTSTNWTSAQLSEGEPFTHVYHDLGTFVLQSAATFRNWTVFGNATLVPLRAQPPVPASISQIFPVLSTTFTNGSFGGPNYPWIHVGQSVNVSAEYASVPTFPGYVPGPPTLIASPGAERTAVSNNLTGVSATYSFSSPGMFQITMVGPIAEPWGTIYQNYTWSVFVAPAGSPIGCLDCYPSGSL